ncbi:MAG TPA: hypothetical protein VIT46_01210 [Gaiellaceae bacterium]
MRELDQELVTLGRALDVPEAPDLVPAVLGGIDTRRLRSGRRRLVLALAVIALAALAATLAIPDARSALLRFLQIGGARIELVDELPVVSPSPAELELMLGQRVSLDEARRSASFELLELHDEPDAVYLGDRGTVWFLYGRPDAVRLLVAQTPEHEIDEPFILKKLAASGTSIEPVTVRGQRAYFLSGEPHIVMLLDEFGVMYPESARLARDVLVWAENGRTVRLEGDLTRADALEIADSLD